MKPHDVLHRLYDIHKELLKTKEYNSNAATDDRLVKIIDMVYTLGDDVAIHLPDNEFERYGISDIDLNKTN